MFMDLEKCFWNKKSSRICFVINFKKIHGTIKFTNLKYVREFENMFLNSQKNHDFCIKNKKNP